MWRLLFCEDFVVNYKTSVDTEVLLVCFVRHV